MIKYLRTCFFVLLLPTCFSFAAPPKNVIVMIGDGMGPEQVKAAGMYAHGTAGTLSFESLPYQAQCTTYSADNSVTDSAAAGTAIATGNKVDNGDISLYGGNELETLLEYFKARAKSTGLVTTVYISHATPAAFGAHETDRGNYSNIVSDYLNQTRPNVLMGGTNYISSSAAVTAGYTVVTDNASMIALDTNAVNYLSGQFSGGDGYALPWEYDGNFTSQPHLSGMTATALDILDNDPDGFFLMVEGGMIDWACHDNDDGGVDGENALKRMIHETIEFSDTVQIVLNWAAGRTDTLVIVTADHETGGLTVVQNNGQGLYPTVTWSTGDHTAANVSAFATGLNAELITGTLDNTDFFNICTSDEHPPQRLRWMFDEEVGMTVSELSSGGHDGTLTNMDASAWVDGITGTGLSFDGDNDYVDLIPSSDLISTDDQPLTIAFWVNPALHKDNNRMINIHRGSEDGSTLQIGSDSGGNLTFLCLRFCYC